MKKTNSQKIADKSTEVQKEKCKKVLKPEIELPVIKETNSKTEQGEPKSFQLNEYIIENYSKELLSEYGKSFLKNYDIKSLQIPPSGFIIRHNFNPLIRSKMVDWMFEVFHTLKSNEETLFGAVKIMDSFFWKSKSTIKNEDIHLIGVLSIYIASKIYDLYPIDISNLIHKIGHDTFSIDTIRKMEKKIIKTIDYDVMIPNTYEFIQFLLYDFYINNKKSIEGMKIKSKLAILENCSIWIAKFCNLFDKYSSESPVYLSVACLFVAYDMMKDNCENFSQNMEKFFENWFKFIIKNIGESNVIESLYKSINITYKDFPKLNLSNLLKYHELYFE